MADTCTASTNPTGCGHYSVSLQVGGVAVDVQVAESELLEPFTDEDRQLAARVLLRLVRQSGLTLAQLAGRVIRGDEATNVKSYSLLGPGVAITKTNIGSTYVNVCSGLNGERTLIDFTGCQSFRAILNANLVATGPFQVRIVRDADDAVLYESPSITQTGERELDTGAQTIPAVTPAFDGLTLVRVQAKSGTAQDDPVFRRCAVAVW